METKDPLTDPANLRTSLFPIRDDYLWRHLKKQQSVFWIREELSFVEDIPQWNALKEEERYFMKHILGFFAMSDLIVNANMEEFLLHVTVLELKMVYQYQCMIEGIHSEVYAEMLETFIRDDAEREIIKNGALNFPAVKKKRDWCYNYIQEGTLAERLVCFVITELLFFSGSFCAIFYMKKRGLLLQGVAVQNELIARDEAMHIETGIYVYQNLIHNKLSKKQVLGMILEAVAIEKEYIEEAIPVKLIGMSSESMLQYIKYLADDLAMKLVGETIYGVENPFEFMMLLGIQSKSNFFEKRVTDYAKHQSVTDPKQNVIKFDAEY